MATFERGARVQHIYEAYSPYSNQHGTVTHLHGDPGGFDEDDDGAVWVQFDNGEEAWIDTDMLVHAAQ